MFVPREQAAKLAEALVTCPLCEAGHTPTLRSATMSRTAFEIGQRVTKHLPWQTGLRECVVVDRRVPEVGEYIMDNSGAVFRRSAGMLSARDAAREYWIIEEVSR